MQDDVVIREDGLTEEEGQLMDSLCEVVDAWDELELQHPNENAEFYAAVHRIQDMMSVRIARRLYPMGWVTYPVDS